MLFHSILILGWVTIRDWSTNTIRSTVWWVIIRDWGSKR